VTVSFLFHRTSNRSNGRPTRHSISAVALALGLLGTCGAVFAQPAWEDDFDAYPVGSLAGTGGWAGWDNNAAATADVSTVQARSAPHSLQLLTGSDLVQIYDGVDSGRWVYTAHVYVPTGHTGDSFFILLNTYAHGGPYNWSTTVQILNGQVISQGGSDFAAAGQLPVIFDAWVELRVEIDFDLNQQTISYGGTSLASSPWHASGSLRIQAIDLFSNGASPVFFDDLSLEPIETLDLINIAPLGTAAHTSQLGGFAASLGIDGDFGNFTHTAAGNGGLGAAVWELDLGVARDVSQIIVNNRTSCCGSRLRDIVVSIHDASYFLAGGGLGEPIGDNGAWGEAVYQSGLLNPENELGGGVITAGPAALTLDLVALEGAALTGRFIRVTRLPDDDLSGTAGEGNPDEATVLSLGEVQVLVDKASVAPSISQDPQGAAVAVGSCHRFTVSLFNAEGAASVTYRWRKDGDDIAGETDDNLFLAEVSSADAGSYSVVVDVDGLVLVSAAAELTVTAPNLALGGTATHTATDFGGAPERAIDGNTNGAFGGNSVTHTTNTAGTFFEVALAATSTIESIVLWNRTDCCAHRLANIKVSVLDDARAPVYEEDFFTDGSFPDTTVSGFSIDVGNVEGRIVRIERLGPDSDGNNFLSFAEIQIFGNGPPVAPSPNLAARCGSITTQSTTNGAFTANLAIDGNLGNFTHTVGTDDAATWQVELPADFEIGLVTLYNRTSCCGSRLRDIIVEILDAAGDVVFESPLLNPENELGAFPNGPASLRVDLQFGESGVVTGRTIRVRRTADPDLSGSGGQGGADESNVLSLGEVEVLGPIDCDGTGDAHCQGLTVDGPENGKPGVYTITAAAIDDTGDAISYSLRADDGNGGLIQLGPQAENVFTMRLPLGSWTVAVSVDDSTACPTEPEDSVCTEVVEVVCDDDNLAPAGVASQSTTGFGGEASFAIDCNTDGIYPNGSTTHSATGDVAPSWQVDLLESYPIDRVVVWGRSDCCADRLTNFRVSILDGAGAEVFGEDFFTDGSFPDPSLGGFVVEAGNAVGQVIRVARLGTPEEFPGQFFLSLAEVEVFEGEAIPPGVGPFLRGDFNLDGNIDISDAISSLNWQFLGGADPGCEAGADSNHDGNLDISDPTFGLNFLFLGGIEPPAPFPECGRSDAASDVALGCETVAATCDI
jgi:hypothetical protein